jgi:putative nucleotidyltransferase with HDIG domain
MRKKISVRDLKLGMFVDELCGSWMNHPFWKSAFTLSEQKDLKALQECGIDEVWIDSSKGLDVAAKVVPASDAKPKAEEAPPQPAAEKEKPVVRVSLDEELDRARKIQAKAKQAVISMFNEARMGNALHVGEAATLVDEINQSVARNPGAMLSLSKLKNKDDYTYLHSVSVCALMLALGRQLGVQGEALKSLGMAGLLHDVGKAVIPEEVLNKPGRLTDEEFDIVKGHSLKGWEILKTSYGVDDIALDVCLHHHERMDGTGYPDKLPGSELALHVKMGAVCDVYDAVTSDRCYKQGWAPAEALHKMAEWKGTHFDEHVFQAFVKMVGIYPVGTLVKLKSGRLGVVTDQSEKSLLTPKVKVFFSSKSKEPIFMQIVDLALVKDGIESVENPSVWGFDIKKITGV